MASKRKAAPVPLFDQVVFAPDRDRVPGTRVVLSFDAEDEKDYLKSIDEIATRKAKLQRRGQDHGAWAELDLRSSGIDPLQHDIDPAQAKERWQAARPLVMPGVLAEVSAEECAAGLALGERLRDPAQLEQWIKDSQSSLPAGLASPVLEPCGSDERTLSKVSLARADGPALWLKSTQLSDHEDDLSVRLRVPFGAEVDDDVSSDETSQRAVSGLAEALIPAARRIDLNPALGSLLTELMGVEPLFTQHIAYWNAPEGGALFHHDAFGEDDCGGQRGVVYTQLSGVTAWLALSLADLADRIEDYCEFLDEGGAEWVRKQLWPDRSDFERTQARIRNREAFELELAEPGCGRFAGLVNLGPEFTSFLADAGHGFFLGSGDAVLMPSHGLRQCVMHSVFCASNELTYGVSAALRGSPAGPSEARG